MTNYERLVQVLSAGSVRYVLVGGFAAILHGAARLTQDLDLVYDRNPENLKRLVAALAPFHPYPRGAPPGLPFLWDAETLHRGLNFTLTTDLGEVDLLGEIAGGGTYERLLPASSTVRVFGINCQCLDLRPLIHFKRAAGRPKDFEAIAELEALLEEKAAQDDVPED